jgi:2-polyprenyl-3-methyl-5-hydroxy-6-metoxy-1,4-benzoquinol methylase
MFINTKHRTNEVEIMDDFTMEGETLRVALDKISRINQLLGGNHLTLQGVKKILAKVYESKKIMIVDVGCGNGDMLRKLADYGTTNNLNFELIGIDANNYSIKYAEQLSSEYKNISYRCENIFDKAFEELEYDIILCTLTLHHFKNSEIVELLTIFNKNAKLGVVINDLQRSAIAYRLFQVLCVLFQLEKMSRNDGLISILRGFKKAELKEFAKKLNLQQSNIEWKWAFRYQWIINK